MNGLLVQWGNLSQSAGDKEYAVTILGYSNANYSIFALPSNNVWNSSTTQSIAAKINSAFQFTILSKMEASSGIIYWVTIGY